MTHAVPPMGDRAPVAILDRVSKVFDTTTAVDDLTLAIEPGEIFGMIGPSGCGKTTIVRLLVGVLAPTSGSVRLLGAEPTRLTPDQRARVGYMPQGFVLYPTLTTLENLRFVAGLLGLPPWRRRRAQRIREVLEFLELWEARDRLARDLSGGMRRRLALAATLVHRPVVLLVDEPTAGLDPVLRQKIWDYLRALCDDGASIIVTTQYIDEAAYCDTVAVLDQGRLAAIGSPDSLRRRAFGGALVDLRVDTLAREDLLAVRRLDGIQGVRWLDDDTLRLVVDDPATATPMILQVLGERGVTVTAATPYQPTFDEVFLSIVGNRRG